MPDRVDALLEALELKKLARAGWVRRGVPAPESVADHSWGVAWLVMALAPADLDRGRALAYAVLHDLAEVRVGDLIPADNVPLEEKSRRERAAFAGLASAAGAGSLLSLWEGFEAQADREARFVRELDRLDMALQALAYHQAGCGGMQEFVDSADAAIRDPVLRPILEEVRRRMALPPLAPRSGGP